MNMIMLFILALVLCAYFWSDCPKMLKDNKQMLLGVVVGLIFCKYFKSDLVEGLWREEDNGTCTEVESCRISQKCYDNKEDCKNRTNLLSQDQVIDRSPYTALIEARRVAEQHTLHGK